MKQGGRDRRVEQGRNRDEQRGVRDGSEKGDRSVMEKGWNRMELLKIHQQSGI